MRNRFVCSNRVRNSNPPKNWELFLTHIFHSIRIKPAGFISSFIIAEKLLSFIFFIVDSFIYISFLLLYFVLFLGIVFILLFVCPFCFALFCFYFVCLLLNCGLFWFFLSTHLHSLSKHIPNPSSSNLIFLSNFVLVFYQYAF